MSQSWPSWKINSSSNAGKTLRSLYYGFLLQIHSTGVQLWHESDWLTWWAPARSMDRSHGQAPSQIDRGRHVYRRWSVGGKRQKFMTSFWWKKRAAVKFSKCQLNPFVQGVFPSRQFGGQGQVSLQVSLSLCYQVFVYRLIPFVLLTHKITAYEGPNSACLTAIICKERVEIANYNST